MKASEFLTTLWGDPLPGRVLVWTLPDKVSRWYSKAEGVDRLVMDLSDLDIYTAVALAPPDMTLSDRQRIRPENAASIAGLWADVDIADPVHKKRNLPPDEDAARDVLSDLEIAPTILVHSGHGLQAWWLFDEPFVFQDPAERREMQRLSVAWHERLKSVFGQRGWTIDATHDLSRILRLPGTLNHKGDTSVPVRVLSSDGPRRPMAEWIRALPERAERSISSAKSTQTDAGARLILDPDAEPPALKLVALTSNDPNFRRGFDQNRPDLVDQSPSAYDMSLASIAAAAGWTDQEIANLIIAFRARHGHDLKLREDYYARTIRRARTVISEDASVRAIQVMHERDELPPPDQIRDDLSRALGIKVNRLLRHSGGDGMPVYRLFLNGGDDTVLDSVDQILSFSRFRSRVAASTGRVINHFSPAKWLKIAQALLDVAEEQPLPPETTLEGRLTALLDEYLYFHTVHKDIEGSLVSQDPFEMKTGAGPAVCIYLGAFRRWIKFHTGEEVSAKTAGAALRGLGHSHTAVHARNGQGSRTTRSVWILEPDTGVGAVDSG